MKKLSATDIRKEYAKSPVVHAGLSFGDKHQVFIAKLRRGEVWALNQLSKQDKAAITPLLEICPPPVPRPVRSQPGQRPKEAKAAKPLDQHIKDSLTTVRDEWTALPFFLDTQFIPAGGIPSSAAAKLVFDQARALKVAAIPVTALRFTSTFQEEISKAITLDQLGVMIRLQMEDFSSQLGGYLDGLLTLLRTQKSEIDILIDLGHRGSEAEVKLLGQSCVSSLPELNDWRTVTLASGCFPGSISDWALNEWVPLERCDWLGWKAVRQVQVARGERLVSYGDFGVRRGGKPQEQARKSLPNLRYTCLEKIITRRGDDRDGQFQEICKSLISKPEFSGASFSQGDAEIQQRADEQGLQSNGQAEQWIQWSTNHHLTLTSQQLRELA